jgi:hypothetical protein
LGEDRHLETGLGKREGAAGGRRGVGRWGQWPAERRLVDGQHSRWWDGGGMVWWQAVAGGILVCCS